MVNNHDNNDNVVEFSNVNTKPDFLHSFDRSAYGGMWDLIR